MSELIAEFDLCLNGDALAPTIAVKDSIDVAGFATRCASRAFENAPASAAHAKVVERLLNAGWRLTGKTNMHELAFGMTGINDAFGMPRNPQDASLIPGGSSSGSASAVGLGLVDAALGTDTGGSIRGPAACCGVVGLKPTFGRVSRRGVVPRETTLDCVGPLAIDVEKTIAVMNAIDPTFAVDRAKQSGVGVRVGVLNVNADLSVLKAVDRAVSVAGFKASLVTLALMEAAHRAGLTVINNEMWRAFGHFVGSGLLGNDVETRLHAAASTRMNDLERAESVRSAFVAEVDHMLTIFDVLILPTLPSLPMTIGQARNGASMIAMSSLIRPFNLSGHPALSLPIPVEGTSIYAGLQIVGRTGADEIVCAVARHLEMALKSSS